MSWRSLAKWEIFKLRGRRVIWILLAIVVLFSGFIALLRFGDYQFKKDAAVKDEVLFVAGVPRPADDVIVDCRAFLAGEDPELPAGYGPDDIDRGLTGRECELEIEGVEDRLVVLIDEFTLPGAIPKALRWTQLVAVPVFAFLTVLVIGSEYGWGTLRSVLMRGAGRRRLLSVKLGLIVAVVAATWLLALATVVVTSLIVTPFASGVGHGDWTGAVLGDVATDTLKAWYSVLPYVAFGAFMSILLSSRAGGTLAAAGVAVGYFFFELFSMGRLVKLFDGVDAFSWFGTAAEYDLGWTTAAWMFGEGGQPIPGFALVGAIGTVDYPPDLHAFLVMTTYGLVFTGLAFWLFRRRDVAGPSG